MNHESVASSAIIGLRSDTHPIVFYFDLSEDNWFVAKPTCHEAQRLRTVYNSLLGLGADFIETRLRVILGCIINTNSVPYWSDSSRIRSSVIQGQS